MFKFSLVFQLLLLSLCPLSTMAEPPRAFKEGIPLSERNSEHFRPTDKNSYSEPQVEIPEPPTQHPPDPKEEESQPKAKVTPPTKPNSSPKPVTHPPPQTSPAIPYKTPPASVPKRIVKAKPKKAAPPRPRFEPLGDAWFEAKRRKNQEDHERFLASINQIVDRTNARDRLHTKSQPLFNRVSAYYNQYSALPRRSKKLKFISKNDKAAFRGLEEKLIVATEELEAYHEEIDRVASSDLEHRQIFEAMHDSAQNLGELIELMHEGIDNALAR